jgi:hypothetical protein
MVQDVNNTKNNEPHTVIISACLGAECLFQLRLRCNKILSVSKMILDNSSLLLVVKQLQYCRQH